MAMKRGVVVLISILLGAGLLLALACTSAPSPKPTPTPTAKPSPAVTTAPPSPKPSPTVAKPSPAAKPSFKWPEPLAMVTSDVASAGYNIGAAFADAMLKKGIPMRIVPVGTEPGRMSLITGGRVHFGYLPAPTNYAAFEGALDFAQNDWGPQPIYLAHSGISDIYGGLVTAKDANIKTWADARGKRIAIPTGSANSQLVGGGNLAFGGLTWKDVTIVEVASFAASGRAIIEGNADAAVGGSNTPWAQQLAASPRGVYYPPMPHKDTEGWKRANAVAPFYAKTVVTQGAGITAPIECGNYSFVDVTVTDKSNADLVYNVAKMIAELYPTYKGTVSGINQFDPERLTLSASIPYHEGAIRYYKEIGKWTAEHQKNNDYLIARAKILTQAWDRAISEASRQKTNVQNFPGLWMKIRADALKAAGMEVLF